MKLITLLIFTLIIGLFKNELRFGLPYNTTDFIQIKHEFGRSFHTIFGPSRYYYGTEIQLENNAEIYSMCKGVVVSTCDTCTRGYGKEISIKHNDRIVVRYYYLDTILSVLGDPVKKGQLIGISGSTGLTAINGLGLSLSIKDNRVNPEEFINLNIKDK